MNVQFYNKKTDLLFSELLKESKTVREWVIGKMAGYTDQNNVGYTLNILIDASTEDRDYPDLYWGIYQQPLNDHGMIDPNSEKTLILNGGLIFKGIEDREEYTPITDQYTVIAEPRYTSHT